MKMQRIGDVLQSFSSARIPIKAADRVPGEIPYLGASGVVDHVDGFTHDGSYLCVAEDGANLLTRSLPIAWIQDGRFWANNHLHVLGGVSRNRLKFFQYAIEQANVASFVTGSAQPKLNKASLERIEVPRFGPSREDAIGYVLSTLDDKIAANRATSSGSRQLIQAIAEKSDNRVPLEKLAARSNTSVRPSRPGRRLVAHYSIPNFDTGYPALESAETIRSNKMLIEQACVLVSKLNPDIPRIWSIPAVSEQQVSLASTEFIVLEPSGVTQSQLYAATLHPNFHEQLASLVGGTSKSHQRVKPEEMLKCLVPDVRELTDAQIDFLEALVQLETHAIQETNSLTSTRDELLPLLMSGKISVKEAEQEAAAAGAEVQSEESEGQYHDLQ